MAPGARESARRRNVPVVPFIEGIKIPSAQKCNPCRRTGPKKKWRAQGDDFRIFLDDFVAALPQFELSHALSL